MSDFQHMFPFLFVPYPVLGVANGLSKVMCRKLFVEFHGSVLAVSFFSGYVRLAV